MNEEVEQALGRAREHLRTSTLEGLEATRALLEAAMHASGLTATSPDSMLRQLQDQLEELISVLRNSASFALPRALAEPLSAAIDAEIKRWEQRSESDPDARLVLRAFLGMRELLWEISVRGDDPRDPAGPRPNTRPRQSPRPKRTRVQRFDIED